MSQLSKMRHSRDQWKSKAIGRGEGQRSQRKENTRLRARYDQIAKTLSAAEARMRQLETQLQGLATRPKVEVVHLALQLFLADLPLKKALGFPVLSNISASYRD